MLTNENTAIIILGVSTFEASTIYSSSEAFLNSRNKIKDYFVNKLGLREHEEVLDLFDTNDDPLRIDNAIEDFIKRRQDKTTYLFIYYVGHGGFDGVTRNFILTTRNTKDTNPGVSSIMGSHLCHNIGKNARNMCTFMVLDCCFAAALKRISFQSTVSIALEEQISSYFPEKGVSLLCSSSEIEPSFISNERQITMFSEALNEALRKGSNIYNEELLTFRQLGESVFHYIKRLNVQERARPEVHTPIMSDGDIADIPLFTNPLYRGRGVQVAYNIETRKHDIVVSLLDNNDVEHGVKLLEGFLNDFGTSAGKNIDRTEMESLRSLEENRPERRNKEVYEIYLSQRAKLYEKILSGLDEIYPRNIDLTVGDPKKEADKLKEGMKENMEHCFPHLMAFATRYARHPKILTKLNLFESEFHISPENQRLKLVQKGQALVDEILMPIERIGDEAMRQQANAHIIKTHFIEQRPKEQTILRGAGIFRKISNHFSIKDISLELRLGEITSVAGKNGNGKTSLLRILAGELEINGGKLTYPFLDNEQMDWATIKKSIGFVKQKIKPWRSNFSLRQQLQFTASMKGIRGEENLRHFEFIIARLGLDRYKDNYWDELSSGYQLRFELARQLIWRPRLLILDEPLANLDIKTCQLFLNDLRSITDSISHSMSVVISSQNIDEVERISDGIIFLRNGEAVYSGDPAEIKKEDSVRCYEIQTDKEKVEIQIALSHLGIKEIKQGHFYCLIYMPAHIPSYEIMKALDKRKIQVRYFKDITQSARLLFEQ